MSVKKFSLIESILWIFSILFLLAAITPYLLGFKIKSDYTSIIGNISELIEIEINIKQYEQGFYSSQVLLEINIPEINEPVQFTEEIIHGPLYFGLLSQGKIPFVAAVVNGQLKNTGTQDAVIQNLFSNQTPLVYQEIIDFSGNVNVQAYVPAINTIIDDENGPVTIKIGGMIINEYYSSSLAQLKGDAKIPSINIQSSLQTLKAQNIKLSFSGVMGNNNLIIGDSVASIGLISVDSTNDQFVMRDLNVSSITTENLNFINSGTQMSVREIYASNQKFGPVQLNLSLNGLDAQSLIKLQDIQKDLETKSKQGNSADQINAMMITQVMGVIPNLIKQAEIKINPLSLNSELGKLEADLQFKLDGLDQNMPNNPMFLMGAINLNLNFSIDDALLKQFIRWELENKESNDFYQGNEKSKRSESDVPIDQKVSENIRGLIDLNWLKKKEGVYLTSITMKQGKLLINDKPVDPMQHLMSTMQ